MNVLVPVSIAAFFFIIKIVEMKYIHKEWKPLKYIIRDTLLIFVISLFITFLNNQYRTPIQEFVDVLTNTKSSAPIVHPEVFTDLPGF